MKKLFTLLICAFAWIGVNAQTLTLHNATEAANVSAAQLSGITKIVLDGDFGNGWEGGDLINAGKTEKTGITEIDLSKAQFNSGAKWSFKNFGDLQKVTWPSNANADYITEIPAHAFEHCGFETLHIPGYITSIARDAIVEASDEHYLKNVIFDEYDANGDGISDVNMQIAQQAFQLNYGLSDVYIETNGNLSADTNAFPLHQTWAHGDVELVLANLHFPESKAEEYVNMNHVLTEEIANDNGKFQAWLVEHYEKAGDAQNGFYEFVSNGVISKKEWPAQFLMTYSHPTLDQVVPKGVKAYVVSDITTSGDKVTLKLTKINVIPANTGVILFGGANSKTSDGKHTLNMMAVNYTGPVYDRNSSIPNFLTATCSTNPGYSTAVVPYGKDQYNVVHRDFVFGKFSNTESGKKYYEQNGNYGTGSGRDKGDWYGFFRVKAGSIKDINPGKAYLRLSESEYPLPDGGEIIMDVTDQRDGSLGDVEFYRTEYFNKDLRVYTEGELQAEQLWYLDDQGTKLEWEKNWGVRQLASGFTMAKFMGEIEDEDWMISLGLSNVEAKEAKSGDIYNLQGMKVVQPTKGVYIQNGKKYIVK